MANGKNQERARQRRALARRTSRRGRRTTPARRRARAPRRLDLSMEAGRFIPMYTRLPELAGRESRSVHAMRAQGDLPAGEYLLVEAFCADPACDCRRVMLMVHRCTPAGSPRHVLTVGWGWESTSFYDEWVGGVPAPGPLIKGPAVQPGSPQCPYEQDLLNLVKMVLDDPMYQDRIARHYQLFKAAR